MQGQAGGQSSRRGPRVIPPTARHPCQDPTSGKVTAVMELVGIRLGCHSGETGQVSLALTSVNLLRKGGEPRGKVLLASRSHYADQYAEVPEAEQLTQSRHCVSKLRAGAASTSLWVTGPKHYSPRVSAGFFEVRGLSSPSRSEPVSSSSALATTEAGGGRLGSLGRPSKQGTALPLLKAMVGGGTLTNHQGCHASPWSLPLRAHAEQTGAGGTPEGRGPAESVWRRQPCWVFDSGVMARAWEQPRPLQPPPCSLQGEPAPFPREERGASGAVPGLGLQCARSSSLRSWVRSQDRVSVQAWRRGGGSTLTRAGRPPEAAGHSGGPGSSSGNPTQALATAVQPSGTLADIQRGPGAGPPPRPAATS